MLMMNFAKELWIAQKLFCYSKTQDHLVLSKMGSLGIPSLSEINVLELNREARDFETTCMKRF